MQKLRGRNRIVEKLQSSEKMVKSWILLMASFSLFGCVVPEAEPHLACGKGSSTRRTVKLSLRSRKIYTGEWVDTISALADSGNASNNVTLDVTHTVTECEGRRLLYIQGVNKDNPIEEKENKLYFHPKCGKNAAVLGDGRTAQKINAEEAYNSVLFTHRPLINNEIFEVRLDRKNTKYNRSLGIGISTVSPTEMEIPPQMWKTTVARIMHNGNIYTNSTEVLRNYGRNLNELQVGDRVGVMRNAFGTLHFFVNGVDQGPAASNVPYPVYGVFELWQDAVKATIVDASHYPLL